MAFTANNDINILQASDIAVVGAGAGNDTYVLSPSTLSANQKIEISDFSVFFSVFFRCLILSKSP